MDIYSYLKKDHRKIRSLMEDVSAAKGPKQREAVFDELHEMLVLHAEAKQATFYTALENAPETQGKITEARDDYDEIREYMKKLSRTSADNDKWIELFGEFKHAVEHHIKSEETRIFEKAQHVLAEEEAEQLAEDMEALKRQAMEEAA